MKYNLNKFFQDHSGEEHLEKALDMIVEKAESAKEALESEDEDEFIYFLLEAHKYIEAVINELGVSPEQIRQKYPRGIKKYKKYSDNKSRGYDRYPYDKHYSDYDDVNPRPHYPEPGRDPNRPNEQPNRPSPSEQPTRPVQFPPGYRNY